jgi:hypothetical protein
LVVFIVSCSFLNQEIQAQNTNFTLGTNNGGREDTTNVNTLIVGIIGIIGTLAASIITLFWTNKHNLEKDKKERQFVLVKEKINLYNFLIYYFEVFMRFIPWGDEGKDEMKRNTEAIDTIVKDKWYMLNSNAFKQWMNLRINYIMHQNMFYLLHDTGKTREDQVRIPFKVEVSKLMDSIITEYNDNIIPKYKEITGLTIQKIEHRELSVELRPVKYREDLLQVFVFDIQSQKGVNNALLQGKINTPSNKTIKCFSSGPISSEDGRYFLDYWDEMNLRRPETYGPREEGDYKVELTACALRYRTKQAISLSFLVEADSATYSGFRISAR